MVFSKIIGNTMELGEQEKIINEWMRKNRAAKIYDDTIRTHCKVASTTIDIWMRHAINSIMSKTGRVSITLDN